MSDATELHYIADIARTHKPPTRVNRITRVGAFPVRFSSKVQVTESGCWEWRGATNSKGYGCLRVDGKAWLAHRYSYTLAFGEIPPGLTLDHLCRNIVCIHPEHLEPVPSRTNTLRSSGPTAVNARRTTCRNGHPLAGANLLVDRKGYRNCRACRRSYPSRVPAAGRA